MVPARLPLALLQLPAHAHHDKARRVRLERRRQASRRSAIERVVAALLYRETGAIVSAEPSSGPSAKRGAGR
ncbi:MAG: hypothetical protein ACXWKO_02365 [Phenylobacterium sp.]